MTKIKHYPKRLLSVMLAVFIALTLIPLQAAASAPSAEDSFTLTENASGSGWSYSAMTKTLTLDGTELTYSGSESLFNFTESDVNVVITGTNKIDLQDAAEGASAFSCPNGTISIKSTGILKINEKKGTVSNDVYMASAETSVVLDGGYYYTNAFKAADENSTVTVNSGCVIITRLSDAGSKVIVNGGYIMVNTCSKGDVVVKGGIISFTSNNLGTGFESGSLTCSNCIVETNAEIDQDKCKIDIGENAVILRKYGGITMYSDNTEVKDTPVELTDEVTGGWLVNTSNSTDKHSTIKSGAKLKGAFYFNSGEVTVEPGADLREATLYIVSSTVEPTLTIDGNSGTGNIACGTICALNPSSGDTAKKLGIYLEGPANITGGNLIGLSYHGSGVDISAEDGSISGTQIIGIPAIASNNINSAGVLLNKTLAADSTSSIIGNGEHFFYNRNVGGVVLGSGVQLPDCAITTNGTDGTDLVIDAPLKFDLENVSTSPYGDFNPNKECSGKGWKYFTDNNFGEYSKFLPSAGGDYRILVLDNLRYVTNANNAAVEITGYTAIDRLVIVVKGECLLKYAGKGIISDISKPVEIVGYDENSKLSVLSEYKNQLINQSEYDVKNAVYTSGDLTIKNLTIDIKANALQGQMIYAGNDLILMNSNITTNLNPYGQGNKIFTALYSDNDMYIVGSNNFCFTGKTEYAFESNNGSIYTGIFKLPSHTADNYNGTIASGVDIKKITANEYGITFSTVPFDFNREKYDINISDKSGRVIVTLTDKDPKVYYGDEPFEINADDFFVGGSKHYALNHGSLSSLTLGEYDPDNHIFSGTPINKDADYNVAVSYNNKIDNTTDSAKANLLIGMPERFSVWYVFKVEMRPKINATYNAEGGEVTVTPEQVIKGGDSEVVVTPKEGWRVKSVKVDGTDVKLTDGKLQLTNITDNTNVDVEFEAIPKYKVTVTTEGSGKVTPETSEFYEGSNAEFTVTPDKGYYVKSVTVDGKAVELTDGKYTFNNITEEHTLSVVFEINTYDLTVECGANGTASLTSMTDVEEGTLLSCVLTPNAGYKVKSVTLNGKALSVNDNKVSFTLNEDSVLRIEFAKKSSGGSSGGGGSRPSTPTENKPAINGTEKSWADIAADIAKLPAGSNVVINMNGETSVPSDVIEAIRDVGANVEFVVDSTRSWVVDGANITVISAADFSMLPGNADKSALRGVTGADIIINGTEIPAELKLTFRKEFAGQFANLYSLTDGRLVFRNCVKVSENGSAVITGADVKGEYIVMVCEFSDRPGDMNNDGVLNALDSSAILKSVTGTETGANPQMADFNGDGALNALDASAILKWIVAA